MLISAFYCCACRNCHLGKVQWLEHLVSEGHQRLAKRGFLNNWDVEEQACCLIVEGTLPVGKDAKIIQYLSSRDSGTFVTDFVWWEEERPTVGFVRFRSPERALEVLASLQNGQFTIEPNQICNVKDGWAIPEHKWDKLKELLLSHDNVSVAKIPGSNTNNSSQMLAFGFYCSVCRESHLDKHGWLQHLLQDNHQRGAREELLLGDESDRANVLVVYGKLPVGGDLKVIEYLSKDSVEKFAFPTDFVWWPDRSRLGFVQFRSIDTKRKVLSSLEGEQFQLGDEDKQVCYVRDGCSFSEIEWNGLLPDFLTCCATLHQDNDVPELPQLQLSTSSSKGNVENPCSYPFQFSRSTSGSSSLSPDDNQPLHRSLTTALIELPLGKPLKQLGLKDHLRSIRKLIEIPDEDYNIAQDIMSQLKKVSQKGGAAYRAPYLFRASLSRHWILKLKCPPSTNSLSLIMFGYMDVEDIYQGNITLNQLKEIDEKWLRPAEEADNKNDGGCGSLKKFLSYPASSAEVIPVPPTGIHGYLKYKIKTPFKTAPLKVLINTNPYFAVEGQVWKLVRYLCSFDPRCYPVLAVAYYWAQKNSIRLGEERGTYKELPEPLALFWLLLTFLHKEGLIPSPNTILEQPHKTINYRGKEIGFSNSARMATAWREEVKVHQGQGQQKSSPDDEQFANQVFTLLYKFFLFCGTTLAEGNGWILNTRDGELLPLEECMSEKAFKDSKLTLREKEGLMRDLGNGQQGKKIVMLHPIIVGWRISTTSSAEPAFKAMKKTGLRLKEYLEEPSPPSTFSKLGNRQQQLGFTDFLKLLQV